MVSSKQQKQVDQRVEFACVTNAVQETYKGKVINVHAAIRLAFVLGTRFGLSQPYVAGDYLHTWLGEHTLESSTEELAIRHERAMRNCVWPLTMTEEEYETLRGDEDE